MSLYEPLGGGRFRATELTQGPWDPRHQHGSPPAALLSREIERVGGDMVACRLTVDILGPIPVGEVEVRAEVVRPGRRVQCVSAEMTADGRPVAHARAWRLRRADTAGIASEPTPAPAPLPRSPAAGTPLLDFGYLHACEWRFSEGAFLVTGPSVLWARLTVPVVAGEEPSPLQRVAGVADTASGISSELDFTTYTFANVDLTLHLLRELHGEWVCMEAASKVGPSGAGLCRNHLYDDRGDLGSGAQTLFIARRD